MIGLGRGVVGLVIARCRDAASRNKDRPRRSLTHETKSVIKNTWCRGRRNLSVRGSTFPGRRVSTHRHTCLRKASFAYAIATPPRRVLPSPRIRSTFLFLCLSCSFFPLRRVHHHLRDSSCRRMPPCHGLNIAALCEKGNEKGVRACREHGLNVSHGRAYTSRSGRRNWNLCTSSFPSTRSFLLFLLLA